MKIHPSRLKMTSGPITRKMMSVTRRNPNESVIILRPKTIVGQSQGAKRLVGALTIKINPRAGILCTRPIEEFQSGTVNCLHHGPKRFPSFISSHSWDRIIGSMVIRPVLVKSEVETTHAILFTWYASRVHRIISRTSNDAPCKSVSRQSVSMRMCDMLRGERASSGKRRAEQNGTTATIISVGSLHVSRLPTLRLLRLQDSRKSMLNSPTDVRTVHARHLAHLLRRY